MNRIGHDIIKKGAVINRKRGSYDAVLVNIMAVKDRRESRAPISPGEIKFEDNSRRNRFFQIFGECLLIRDWLDAKPISSFWLPLKLLDAILRGFSQVVFANSTLSGLFVVIGLFIADRYICAAGVLASVLATLTSLFFNQPWTSIGNGLTNYNAVLVGTVTASLCPHIVENTHGPAFLPWILIALGAIMSSLITSGLVNLCKGVSIPPMTLPFNIIDLLIFICLPPLLKTFAPSNDTIHLPSASNISSIEALHNATKIDWAMVLRGSLLSLGQVYAAESITCSLVMYAGILLYSPLLALALFGGSFLASVCALGLTDDYPSIYSGLWGYNPALTAGAIAVTFYVPTILSFFNASMAVVFTVAVEKFFTLILNPAGLPILTVSFVISGALFLAVSSGLGKERLFKAPDGRPPELQRWRHQRRKEIC